MTNEEKKLLLQDLCARLPYDVRVQDGNGVHILQTGNTEFADLLYGNKRSIKPYLRPMSSMTEEEVNEFNTLIGYEEMGEWIRANKLWGSYGLDILKCSNIINWLNAHHFDYRGLIEKGLALVAPEGMYNI